MVRPTGSERQDGNSELHEYIVRSDGDLQNNSIVCIIVCCSLKSVEEILSIIELQKIRTNKRSGYTQHNIIVDA